MEEAIKRDTTVINATPSGDGH